MLPKTRSELRTTIVLPLYKFLKDHDDLLEFEFHQLIQALKSLFLADIYLFHLGHTKANELEDGISKEV